MTQAVEKVEVAIVGAGPAGLTAALYCARAGLKPLVAAGGLDGGQMPGGQLMITTEVENFPGFPEGIAGPELMERMFQQAERFGAVIVRDFAQGFGDLKSQEGGPFNFRIGEEQYEAQCLILANGASARWLGAPDEDQYRNRGISACATCDGPLPAFRQQPMMVVGGGDSACEEALFLTRFASHVTMIHRRDQLRASKIMAERVLNHPNITVRWNTIITGYQGDNKLEKVLLKDTISGIESSMDIAGLFMAIGHVPNTKELVGTGVELDEENYLCVHDHVYTNIDGVFAAGDCHDRIFRQAVTASGFGCMAAITAERWLESKQAV